MEDLRTAAGRCRHRCIRCRHIAGPKSTWPGKKEIYRHPHWEEDIIQLAHEPRPDNYQRLLRPVMRNGEMIPGSLPPLSEIRELAQQNLQAIPNQYRAL